ncbi:DUF2179 domain-containing protein [Ancylomarina sp. 16SWW S1-10-2]|uniref:DUF2179 domain-containing protein n=1 Tax=Ancylomarina sp. 16SWW S1-10-2 TaxID=2499681 RepID=UPI0012AD6653|nr:DUF2179 domain-containing protein [Ancylomarina sp. 16SWW S1-10-2]MRT92240.1 DUF2179 domain-containing protein [Ancylomarina sp. 16SWW S1-10-2]
MDSIYFDYIILPLLIFMARICDVSLDTIRVIMVSKGYRKYAPYIGFVQVLIWIVTITRIMENLDNWLTYVAYAAGFGMGTYIGMRIEEKIAMGYELLRIITRSEVDELVSVLRQKGYSVTSVVGEGRDGEVGIVFMILKRKVTREVIEIVNKYNPKAYYTIEDIRFVADPEYLPPAKRHMWSKTQYK